ncbi:PH domain-containing protein [Pedobacter endophyticus]|uniref:Bacterial Pleckstrin homology domain-containing protein n=1 Tax=Pedobacter endophyticus TaxID=2789740 RepID=A0A7U3Q5K1_9SPHI|nr:PH domain-containing protein [Pedobacter endophyticus]QPH38714.1 hypothetical protein IZT61_16800 [Pedobacter endophyticus]
MDYKASLDTLCKGTTIGILILFIAIGQKNVRLLISVNGDIKLILIHGGVLLLLISTFVGSYLYSTSKYSLSGETLVIHRPVGEVVIKLSDIAEIRLLDSTDFSGVVRTFGNSGLFGYYGKYYNSKIGNMTWFVTQKKNRILLRTHRKKKIIISPDDVSLVEKVNHYLNQRNNKLSNM